MNRSVTLQAFFDDIQMKDIAKYEDDLRGVIEKLNQYYYGSGDEESNRLIVGFVCYGGSRWM